MHSNHGYEDKKKPLLFLSFCSQASWTEKGSDRFYPRPDPLSHLKRTFFQPYINTCVTSSFDSPSRNIPAPHALSETYLLTLALLFQWNEVALVEK